MDRNRMTKNVMEFNLKKKVKDYSSFIRTYPAYKERKTKQFFFNNK